MREIMSRAEVGDDVFGDDPSINRLEERVAERFKKDAALLFPTGTQSNLCALLAHCGRGEEYIVGQEYHTYRYEAGGAAALGGIVPQTIELDRDGTFSLALLKKRIKPDDPHFPVSKLIALENTHVGKVVPLSWQKEVAEVARSSQLSLHIDGARIFNASVASGHTVEELTAHADSVSVCFSKGLGCPVGSVLVGNEGFIRKARRWRKMTGGGMRQAGILAAAMNHALDAHVERLEVDHAHAFALFEGLQQTPTLSVEYTGTNMVYVEFADEESAHRVANACLREGILIPQQGIRKRLVTHLNIEPTHIERIINVIQSSLGEIS